MSDDPAVRVWARLRVMVLERHDRRRKAAEALGMSFIKVKALRKATAGPLTMRELTEHLNTDRPYTTLVVDELVRRGLVVRESHPDDRRLRIVTATPAGEEAAGRAERILGEPPPELRALSADDLATLDRITALLAAAPGPSGTDGPGDRVSGS
ncbi:MarR family winged helix-turn-helix transcriptional regulator [Amycolatopsis jiangsuensis]|uniref:DNA-binding MarR family transcriptional regulator n=1 Tax=Amycolatopsis jiangsuensis TaxID=1181879 RepID=A0A840ITN9_9PSEU|nr:MarR family transcriptional regulator [Amycolatopsis jiangsuensis]MBB4684825.1 DNA-binding MarR family transcriptional regulator [Amycolatopsis jiangsuensis]